ncbi:hypothetical protein, partial [Oleiphilus sp. HI0128]
MLRMLGFVLAFMSGASTSYSATPVDAWLLEEGGSIPTSGKVTQWKFAHPAPPVSHLPPVWQKGIDWIQRKTNNELQIKMYG